MGGWVRLFLVVGLALAGAALSSAADEDERARAEALVRLQYYEGVPYAEARALGAAGAERLAELLADPAEREHHPNAVVALGISGQPAAFPALRAFARRELHGEVSSAAYRARLALPIGMGHLARHDRRALDYLLAEVAAGDSPREPGWSYRHLRGPRLAALLRRTAVTGLAVSGLPEAEAAIDAMIAAEQKAGPHPRGDARGRLLRHLEESHRLCRRVARDGAERAFAPGDPPGGPH